MESNIARYRKLLATSTDPNERKVLRELLGAEFAKLSGDVTERINLSKSALNRTALPLERSDSPTDHEGRDICTRDQKA